MPNLGMSCIEPGFNIFRIAKLHVSLHQQYLLVLCYSWMILCYLEERAECWKAYHQCYPILPKDGPSCYLHQFQSRKNGLSSSEETLRGKSGYITRHSKTPPSHTAHATWRPRMSLERLLSACWVATPPAALPAPAWGTEGAWQQSCRCPTHSRPYLLPVEDTR